MTGANRGLGRALVHKLIEHGAAKVYAGTRKSASLPESVVPVALDVTDRAQVAAAASALQDVSIVISNAGVARGGRPLTVSLEDARQELEVNYLGPLSIAQAFAPVLAANGGGVLVHVLSVLSWVTSPPVCSYAASKAAAWSMTNALREQLRGQGTLVVAVHSDSIDTDMTAGIPGVKHSPELVAEAVMHAITAGDQQILFDDYTRMVKAALSDDLRILYNAGQF